MPNRIIVLESGHICVRVFRFGVAQTLNDYGLSIIRNLLFGGEQIFLCLGGMLLYRQSQLKK